MLTSNMYPERNRKVVFFLLSTNSKFKLRARQVPNDLCTLLIWTARRYPLPQWPSFTKTEKFRAILRLWSNSWMWTVREVTDKKSSRFIHFIYAWFLASHHFRGMTKLKIAHEVPIALINRSVARFRYHKGRGPEMFWKLIFLLEDLFLSMVCLL